MLSDDYAVYFNLKNQVQVILVRRGLKSKWNKMLEDEDNYYGSIVTFWRYQLDKLKIIA